MHTAKTVPPLIYSKRLPEWINLNRLLDVVIAEDYNETKKTNSLLLTSFV